MRLKSQIFLPQLKPTPPLHASAKIEPSGGRAPPTPHWGSGASVHAHPWWWFQVVCLQRCIDWRSWRWTKKGRCPLQLLSAVRDTHALPPLAVLWCVYQICVIPFSPPFLFCGGNSGSHEDSTRGWSMVWVGREVRLGVRQPWGGQRLWSC